MQLHFHIHYELTAIHNGNVTVIANGTRLDYRGACLLLYKPFSIHCNIDHKDEPYDVTVFHFNNDIAAEISPFVNVDQLYLTNITLLPLEGAVKEEAFSLLAAYSEAPERETQRKLLLAALLDLLYRNRMNAITDSQHIGGERLAYVQDIVAYINTHFQTRMTSEELGKKFLVSRQKLDADFKAVMNLTLRQYILNIRIANATRLLSMGEKVADVTYACGFSSESHFISLFKSRMGITPYQYTKISGKDLD